MWLTGILAGRKVAVEVVYLWTGANSTETNIELIKCTEKDYHNIGRPTIMLGDFNAHLEEFDGRTDSNGKLLQDMAEHLDMAIVNTQDKCTKKTTWTARGTSSTIDYCLLSPNLYEKLNYMEIDEEGDKSLGSDHNRLLITFGGKPTEKRVSKPMKQHHITQAKAQTMAQKLEEEVETRQVETYGNLTRWWKNHLEKLKRPTRRKRRRKRWWDVEVREAITRRQLANRTLRGTIRKRKEKKKAQIQKDSREWRKYQSRKIEVTALIQSKMAKVDKRFMEELREAGREAPLKFWRHVQDQTDRPREDAVIKDDATGKELDPGETNRYIERWIEDMFTGDSR
uniref:Putative tick transposon n=1 Tax=Ixodes ricinus TaxID=34613 RepID=A0A6B0V7Z0_IXORI